MKQKCFVPQTKLYQLSKTEQAIAYLRHQIYMDRALTAIYDSNNQKLAIDLFKQHSKTVKYCERLLLK